MIPIPEDHVVEGVHGDDDGTLLHPRPTNPSIRYNARDPDLDTFRKPGWLSIIERDDGIYCLRHVHPLPDTHFDLTPEGMQELAEDLLVNPDGVPEWTLELPGDEDRPEWVPEEYDLEQTYRCDVCEREVPPEKIYRPDTPDTLDGQRVCSGCCSLVRDWEKWRLVDEVLTLRSNMGRHPSEPQLDELDRFLHMEQEGIRHRALMAVLDVAEGQPEAATRWIPFLKDCVESDRNLVESGSMFCLAELAETHPDEVVGAADAMIERLDPETDVGLLEGAIPYTAAVAAEHPAAVKDAVPGLAALLQEKPPHYKQVLLALARIAEEFPEEVLPIADDVLEEIKLTPEPETHVPALYLMGALADQYPHIAEDAIPYLISLLHVNQTRIRANAAGTLLDLTLEYPEKVELIAPRAVDLLEDEDHLVRANAAGIVGRLAQATDADLEDAIPSLIELLDDDDYRGRLQAAQALGQLRATEAREKLEELRDKDDNETVREGASRALDLL